MNNVSLVGRITKDVELREASNGTKYVGFTLAVGEYRNGTEYTNFIPCVAWDRNAFNMAKFLHKGSLISVFGKVSTRNKNENGKYETIVNIIVERVEFLGSKHGSNNSQTIERNDSNFDMDQINTFEPNQYDQQPSSSNKVDEFVSDDDSILWD